MSEPESDLPNLGPVSRSWLASIGIHDARDLRRVGAVQAYVAVKRSQGKASLNLLYALVGAVDGVHWLEVRRARRLELLLQVEDLERRDPQRGR